MRISRMEVFVCTSAKEEKWITFTRLYMMHKKRGKEKMQHLVRMKMKRTGKVSGAALMIGLFTVPVPRVWLLLH